MSKKGFVHFSSWLWQERDYLDTWSVNHFLSGVVLALFLYTFQLSLLLNWIIALILFIAWEIFEGGVYGKESFSNQVSDVLVDSAGFALAWYLVRAQVITQSGAVVITAVYIFLLLWGYATVLHQLKRITG